MPPRPPRRAHRARDRARLHRFAALEPIQVGEQFGGVRVPPVRGLFETLEANRFEVAGQPRREARRPHRFVFERLPHALPRGVGAERRAPGEQRVQRRPQREHVGRGGRVRGAPARLFGREEPRRAEDVARARQRRALVVERGARGEAEIDHLCGAGFGHEHVARFQVAVDDPLRVRVRDPGHRAGEQRGALTRVELVRVRVPVDAVAAHQFHYEVRATVRGRAAVEDARHVRVDERREGVPLGAKALERCFAAPPGRTDLHGHLVPEVRDPLGAVHGAAAAPADALAQPVRADGRARPRRAAWCRRGVGEELFGFGARVEREQLGDLAPHVRVWALGEKELVALGDRHRECGGEEFAHGRSGWHSGTGRQ